MTVCLEKPHIPFEVLLLLWCCPHWYRLCLPPPFNQRFFSTVGGQITKRGWDGVQGVTLLHWYSLITSRFFLAVCNKTLISCCSKPLAVMSPLLSQSSDVSASFSSSCLGSGYKYLSRISFLCYVRHSIKWCELKFLYVYDLFPLDDSRLGFYQPFIYFTSKARFLFSSKIITFLMERVTFGVFKGINGINAKRTIVNM